MKSNTHAERRKYHIIYKTTCTITGRWYLGLHSTDHLDDGYLGSGRHLQASLKKHGKENHSREIVETLSSRKELVQREIELITEEMIRDPMCMNLMKGGGREIHENIVKEKARSKISEVAKAMWTRRKADPIALAEHTAKLNTPEIVAKRGAAIKAKNHKRSPEQLARLSAGQSKYYSTVDECVLKARGQKAAEKRAKVWIIEDQAGNKQEVKDLVKFSEAHGIKRTALYKTEHAGTYRAGYRIVGRA
jgi:hypothetical protein